MMKIFEDLNPDINLTKEHIDLHYQHKDDALLIAKMKLYEA
jgi:hypothetical protein